MKSLSFFTLLFLLCNTLFSQTGNFESALTNYLNSIDQTNSIHVQLKSVLESYEKSSKQFKIPSANLKVDSVVYAKDDGTRFKESYTYENMLPIIIYNDKWDEDKWTNFERVQNTFDANGNLKLSSQENWMQAEWVAVNKYHSEYDLNGNLTYGFSEIWDLDSSKWIKIAEENYQYDSKGNNIFSELFLYDSGLVFTLNITSEYNENGLLASQTSKIFSDEIVFMNTKRSFSYDENNNLVLTIGEHFVENEWVNSEKIISEYDQNNNITSNLTNLWDEESWTNSRLSDYEYDSNNNRLSYLTSNWNNIDSLWIPVTRYSYEYDNRNNLLFKLYEKTDSLQQWQNSTQLKYKYDEDGNLIFATSEIWQDETWVFDDGYLEFYGQTEKQDHFYFTAYQIEVFYSAITDVTSEKNLISDFTLSQNYPNPFNPTTSIEYSVPSNEYVSLKVYDLLGNEVAILVNEEKSSGNYKINFNAEYLSSGVYFYKLSVGNFVETKKLLLMK